MEKIKIKINGQEVLVQKKQTILEAIQEHGLATIPTLCHDPKLPPYGSCYLCVVEVAGTAKLLPSCASPVAEGMDICTHNERIQRARRTALELLLSNHYADCLGPCTQTCPAGVDVQGYIALIAQGKYSAAVRLIKQTNPLPIVCGRVCVRECEAACRRNQVDREVGIDYLKRFAADRDLEQPWTPELPAKNGRRVAVIGGGPAGLTCAYFLLLCGYQVTLFERKEELGGMLRYGIPEYRLPKAILDREINWITNLGVEVRKKACLGRDFTLADLSQQKFDSIFLALGAWKAKKMRLPGEDTVQGILAGKDFLEQMQAKNKPHVSGTVVVVGGGNTALDAARTSLRLGASKVILLYRRTRQEMPAHPAEVDAAQEEGVELHLLAAPVGLVVESDRLRALTCIRMELGEPDESGRRSPVPVAGSEYELPCAWVISAIGQDVELLAVNATNGVKTNKQNLIIVNEETMETSLPGVFAGGDAVTGPSVAIKAIAQGRRAAEAIDYFLHEGQAQGAVKGFLSRKDFFGEIPAAEFSQYSKIEKEAMPELEPTNRIRSFAEVELGFSEEQAGRESSRCMECGCQAYFNCSLRHYADELGVDLRRFLGEVKKYRVDKDHPLINLDANKCISCGRCVRTCSGVLQVSALGFVYRGFRSLVKPAMEKKLLETSCIACGNCIAACPTGAITEKLPFAKPGPWKAESYEAPCTFCSMGCRVSYQLFPGDQFAVAGGGPGEANNGYLCLKGRFGYRFMLDPERILRPLLRRRNRLVEVSWPESMRHAAERLQTVLKEYGPEAVALFASPRLSNEELYLLQKLARLGVGSNMLGSFSAPSESEDNSLDDMLGMTVSTATLADIGQAKVILVHNVDFPEENLIADLRIKDAVRRGARLIVISSAENELTRLAELWLDAKRGSAALLFLGLANLLLQRGSVNGDFIRQHSEGYEEFRRQIASLDLDRVSSDSRVEKKKLEQAASMMAEAAGRVVAVYNRDFLWEKSAHDLPAIANLLLVLGSFAQPGSGLLLLHDFANSVGLMDMGMTGNLLPGRVSPADCGGVQRLEKLWQADLKKIFRPANLLQQMEKGRVKALLVFGEDPFLSPELKKTADGVEFLLVMDTFLTGTASAADVVLPATIPLENSGSLTSCERRIQHFRPARPSATGMENWQVIQSLAQAIGLSWNYTSAAQVFAEIRQANPHYNEAEKDAIWGKELFEGRFPTSSGRARFAFFPVDLAANNTVKVRLLSSEQYFQLYIRKKLWE